MPKGPKPYHVSTLAHDPMLRAMSRDRKIDPVALDREINKLLSEEQLTFLCEHWIHYWRHTNV